MQGLEIAQRFFHDWGYPYLQRYDSALVARVAAGLFHGSQVYGADDELSRDHGWGPMFVVILTDADYRHHGRALQDALSRDAPREWAGARMHYPATNVDVTSVDQFFQERLGFAVPPAEAAAWLVDRPVLGTRGEREHELYLIRHGHVFADPLGAFSQRRTQFHSYPRRAWLERIWSELFNVWHYGQYNFAERVGQRDDPVAAQLALGHFSEAVMRLCLLLEQDYTPYWKWLAWEFRKRQAAVTLDAQLRALATSSARTEQAALVRAMCDDVHQRLDAVGLASADLTGHPHALFCDQTAVAAQIAQEQAHSRAPGG